MLPLTVKEAAPLLGLSLASVYALCAGRRIRHARVGIGRGKIVIPPDAVAEYLSGGTVEPGGEAFPTPTGQPRKGPVRTFGNLDSERLLAAWKEQGAVPSS